MEERIKNKELMKSLALISVFVIGLVFIFGVIDIITSLIEAVI